MCMDPATSAKRTMPDAAISATAADAVAAARGDPGLRLRPLLRGAHVSMPEPTARQASILLVDDREENLLRSARFSNRSHPPSISVTSGGTEALRRSSSVEFACILLDVQMPELDGFELATLISSAKGRSTSRSSSSCTV